MMCDDNGGVIALLECEEEVGSSFYIHLFLHHHQPFLATVAINISPRGTNTIPPPLLLYYRE